MLSATSTRPFGNSTLKTTVFLERRFRAHLAVVLALFITLPYGKFVHGIYRAAALLQFRREEHTT